MSDEQGQGHVYGFTLRTLALTDVSCLIYKPGINCQFDLFNCIMLVVLFS